MAEIKPQREYYWPVLTALKEFNGSADVKALNTRVALNEDLPSDVLNNKSALGKKFYLLMAAIRGNLNLAELVSNPRRGVWELTESGRNAESPDAVHAAIVPAVAAHAAKAKARREQKAGSPGGIVPVRRRGRRPVNQPPAVPRPKVAHNLDVSRWERELLQVVNGLDQSQFAALVEKLLSACGFTSWNVGSNEDAIEGSGRVRVGMVSFNVHFRVDRRTGAVGARDVMTLRGAMLGGEDKAVFFTTGSFSDDASALATHAGMPAVELIDGKALCQILMKHGLGVRMVESGEADPDFFAQL